MIKDNKGGVSREGGAVFYTLIIYARGKKILIKGDRL